MLDLGFLPDIEKIFQKVPAIRHTQLFSATMPGPIVALARRFMTNPIHIRATDPDEGLTQANIRHLVYRAHSLDKDEVIARILQADGRGKTVIFTRTKRAAQRLSDELGDRGFNTASVHGDMSQEARERSMAAFKAGKKDVLIATDVAARGIDVDDVTHVINHTIPDDEKTYLHRAGRTGRAGKTGIAVTFVDWDDLHKWALINRALEFGQPEPVETYSSSPHLFDDLDIPDGHEGTARRPRRGPRRSRRRMPLPPGIGAIATAHPAAAVAAPATAPAVGRDGPPRAARRPRSPPTTDRTTPPRAPARTTAEARSTTTATPLRAAVAAVAAGRAAAPPSRAPELAASAVGHALGWVARGSTGLAARPTSTASVRSLAASASRRRPRRIDPRDQHDRDDHQQEPRHELRDRHRLPAVELVGVHPRARPRADVLREVDEDGDAGECGQQRHPDHRAPHPRVHHRPRPQQHDGDQQHPAQVPPPVVREEVRVDREPRRSRSASGAGTG